jgi:hypothetical protein
VKTDPTFWLLARASGLTAYGLLTGSVLAGLVLKSKPLGRALKPAPTMDVHRFLALLGLGMLALHGGTLLLDQTLHMPLAGLVVPGASPYRPAAVAVGVVAAELMGASQMRIIFRHMLPSFMSHVIAAVSLALPAMIISETALSFLGLGLRPPAISWGILLQDAQNIQTLAIAPWLLVAAVPVIVVILAFNFLGDGLRDAADPYG